MRRHGSDHSEFQTEVSHHFDAPEVTECSFIAPQEFLSLCAERRALDEDAAALGENAFIEPMVLACRLHGEAIAGLYQRTRASDGVVICEPVRSMLYLCILPTRDLPKQDPTGKHFADWALLPIEKVESLFDGAPVECETIHAGRTPISPDDLTEESKALLRVCHEEFLSQLCGE
jgi:hypothetical protein